MNRELRKARDWAYSILVVVVLLAVVLAHCQAGPANMTTEQPERQLPNTVRPGEEFVVTVTFVSPQDGFHAIGLTEFVGAGWPVTVDVAWTKPQAMAANTPGTEKAEYVWEGPYNRGVEFRAEYKVRVPVGTRPGDYTFSGHLEYYIEPFPAPPYEEEVGGDTKVTVS